MSQPVYIVYGRYSGEGRRGNSSVERQMDMDHYRRRADELGLPFVEVPYFDDDKSGFKGDNLEAELGKIFRDIGSGVLRPGPVIGTGPHSRLGRLSANEALFDILRIGIRLDIKGRALRRTTCPPLLHHPAGHDPRRSGTIEITFACGARVCVRGEVSAKTLQRVIEWMPIPPAKSPPRRADVWRSPAKAGCRRNG